MIRLKLFTLVLFLFMGIMSNAQNDFTRKVNGRQVQFKSPGRLKSQPLLQTDKFKGDFYIVLLLSEKNSPDLEKDFRKDGIELNKSLGNNIYLAVVNDNQLQNILSHQLILGYAGSTKVNKFEENLLKPELPEFAIVDEDFVQVTVSHFKDIPKEVMVESLEKMNCSKIKVSGMFPQIDVILHKNDLKKLSKLPWIVSVNAAGRKHELFSQSGISGHSGISRHGTLLYNQENPEEEILNGKNVKIGIWDGNVEEHMDLYGRINVQEAEVTGTDHGTHVAGIMAGKGLLDPSAKGIAPEVQAYTFNFNVGSNGISVPEEMHNAVNKFGINISQNSYGFNNMGGKLFPYMPNDANLDYVANLHHELLHVFAVGNNRIYTEYNTATTSAKNILSVANIEMNGERQSSSSFGPTAGGHLFPHIAAMGTEVLSTSYQNSYSVKTGTSMSCPLVSGAAAQLVQLYRENYNSAPSSSLLKAVMCNTAVDIDNPGPDYRSGFGILDQYNAVKAIKKGQFKEDKVKVGEDKVFHINVPSTSTELRVMLVWNDPWAYPTSENPLINNLDLVVEKNGKTFNSWVLDPANPTNDAIKGLNVLDNMEQVLIKNPEPGKYTFRVKGNGITEADENGYQSFALSYYFVEKDIKLFAPKYEETLDAGAICHVNWFTYGLEGNIDVELSKDGGESFELLARLPEGNSYYSFELPAGFDFDYQIRIVQAGRYSVSKTIKTLEGVKAEINQTGNTTALLKWNNIADAEKYKVFSILKGEITELAEVSDTTYSIENISASEEKYFAVQAVNETHAVSGVRCKAVKPDIQIAIGDLPFFEDFETGGLEFFTEEVGLGLMRKNISDDNTSLFFSGKPENTGSYKYYDDNRFDTYSDYIVSLSSGELILPADKRVLLSLDLVFEKEVVWIGENPTFYYPYFRVKVGEDVLSDIYGVTDLGGANNEFKYTGSLNPALSGTFNGTKRAYYDLSAYAGQKIAFVLEALVPRRANINIDNIAIEELPQNDLAIIGYERIASGVELAAQDVSVTVANFGADSLKTFNLSYTIDKGLGGETTITEVFADTILPFTTHEVSFSEKAEFEITDFSHNVEVSVADTDDNADNDKVILSPIDNYNPQVVIGKTYRVTVDEPVYLSDTGADMYPYEEYKGGQTTLYPADLTKVLKAEIEEFEIAEGDDFAIWSGGFRSAGSSMHDTTLIVRVHRSEDMTGAVVSIAPSGGLLFFWRSYVPSNGAKGWRIKVSQVDATIKNDVRISKITSPVTHTDLSAEQSVKMEIWNFGRDSIGEVFVQYHIDDVKQVRDTITFNKKLSPNKNYTHTFSKKGDFTTFGKSYSLTAEVELEDDIDLSNNKKTITLVNTYPLDPTSNRSYLYNMYFEDEFYQALNWNSVDTSEIVYDVEYNKTYQLDMRIGGAAPTYGHPYKVDILVDWNSNNSLADDVPTECEIAPYGVVTGRLKVPNNATPGIKRMRISPKNISRAGRLYGSVTDFSLKLSGNPTQFDVALASYNIKEFMEPGIFKPQVNVKQIGATNGGLDVKLSIGDSYSEQYVDTLIEVNSIGLFEFPEIDLQTGTYDVTIEAVEGDDVNMEDNKITVSTQVYSFNPSYLVHEGGISHFDFEEPCMNKLKQSSDEARFFTCGTFAKDSFVVFSLEGASSTKLYLRQYDKNLEADSIICNYSYNYGDVRGIAYADEQDKYYSISSTSRYTMDTYATYTLNPETQKMEVKDTINAGGHNLKELTELVSDTEGNLFTIYRPQNLLCLIDNGSGHLNGLAVIPANLMDAKDISMEMDKTTGDIYVGVNQELFVVKPMSRRAEKVSTFPMGIYGLGLPYTKEEAYKVAGLRSFRIIGQTKGAVIDVAAKTIEIEMLHDISFDQLVPDFIAINGGKVSIGGTQIISGETKIDLASPLTLTVTSKDGNATQEWIISVKNRVKTELLRFAFNTDANRELSENYTASIEPGKIIINLPSDVSLNELKAGFTSSEGSELYFGEEQLSSGATEIDYNQDLILTVISDDRVDHINYQLIVNRDANNLAYIRNFRLLKSDNETLEHDYEASISNQTNSIYLPYMEENQSVWAVARFETPTGAVVSVNNDFQESGISACLFEDGVTYKVTSEDGSAVQEYTVVMESPLSVDEFTHEEVQIYPNPTNGPVNISGARGAQVRIINLSGQSVFNTNIITDTYRTDLSRLPAGIYILELRKDNKVEHHKIIIN